MVTRVLVEKRAGFNVEATALFKDIVQTFGPKELKGVRIINCYDIEGLEEAALETVRQTVLSEPNVDQILSTDFSIPEGVRAFRYALLPGQFDQRADSAKQCVELVTLHGRPEIIASRMILLEGEIETAVFERIKSYLINPVEAEEVPLGIPETLAMTFVVPDSVATVDGFTDWDASTLNDFRVRSGFAMTAEDIAFVQIYFKDEEKRNPTITELKVIDTYWSDHCRHTTFLTHLTDIEVPEIGYAEPVAKAYKHYLGMRKEVYGNSDRPETLMDLATINMKHLRKVGKLEDLDVSEEINACSIKIDVDINGKDEPWLLMFKNETHNHPTEIEPFGGAATCLGGAIRDPLSGRSYVYQSMRVTGAADPTVPIEQTLEGKLPQKIITQKAAAGFSAYGNQIGLATGHVAEVYHPGFVAKRMEVGAVIGAAPEENVVRERPVQGDVVILVGGRTGRDGIGGATGSSKAHDEKSLATCGAEVQKGNPPEERKIQRLFRRSEVTRMVKRCNDFGAGGVSVAIGELAESLWINLDAVPKKYEGLDGTELAISESQERMAVVVSAADAEAFVEKCHEENLEATLVAKVTDTGRLVMEWNGMPILNLSRAFLDTNGASASAAVKVTEPVSESWFEKASKKEEIQSKGVAAVWRDTLASLNVTSQKGLIERFDNTIGAGTVLMPFGGEYESTPAQVMAAKLPVLGAETKTVSMMAYGYDPEIGTWSPYHGGLYAVTDAVAKLVSAGGSYKRVRLSLQEYFEKLGNAPDRWGKPFSALLGAVTAQNAFETAAIGGKDSMSGSFKTLNVPPTLIAFAVTVGKATDVVTPELKSAGSTLWMLRAKRDAAECPDFETLKAGYDVLLAAMERGDVVSAYAVGAGGVAAALTKMALGNRIGFEVSALNETQIFEPTYGSIVFEVKETASAAFEPTLGFEAIGKTLNVPEIHYGTMKWSLDAAESAWSSTLSPIFPETHKDEEKEIPVYDYPIRNRYKPTLSVAKPRVFIPVFPGTNCEFDTAIAFEKAGAEVETLVFRNRTPQDVQEAIKEMAKAVERAQIVAIPGGFSAGDEPEGSGKFIASVFRNPALAASVMSLLKERDGLMLGICNGFQALVKLGLLPYGDIRPLDEEAPTLTFNRLGRHVARMARVRVASVMSPWLTESEVGDIYQTAFSHGEGRFYASEDVLKKLAENGQVTTQYVNREGVPTYDGQFNINGSVDAIEGITSPDGRVFGKMGHVERVGNHLYKNIYGEKEFEIFKAGVRYFK